jgi:hypothetical protein
MAGVRSKELKVVLPVSMAATVVGAPFEAVEDCGAEGEDVNERAPEGATAAGRDVRVPARRERAWVI